MIETSRAVYNRLVWCPTCGVAPTGEVPGSRRASATTPAGGYGTSCGPLSIDRHRTREIDRSQVPTPDVVASRLECERGRSCLRVEYVAATEGEVFGIATNYVLYPEAAAIETVPLEQSWYHLLDRGRLAVGESEFRIGCTNADEQTASLLSVRPGSAVLTLEQVIRDDSGRAYNFALAALRGDRDCFVSRARRGGEAL